MAKDKEGKEIEEKPPVEKVIIPDWQKIIDGLSLQIEEVKKDRTEWKTKAETIDKEIFDLKELAKKTHAGSDVTSQLNLFAPWDLFFGD